MRSHLNCAQPGRWARPSKAAAGAVGVPYRTLMDWLRLGRAEGADGPYADLARGLDAATADLERVLMDRVLAGTIDDGRLALDAPQVHPRGPLRRAKIKLARASAEVERKRASGEHVDRQRLEGPGPARLPPRVVTPEWRRLSANARPSRAARTSCSTAARRVAASPTTSSSRPFDGHTSRVEGDPLPPQLPRAGAHLDRAVARALPAPRRRVPRGSARVDLPVVASSASGTLRPMPTHCATRARSSPSWASTS